MNTPVLEPFAVTCLAAAGRQKMTLAYAGLNTNWWRSKERLMTVVLAGSACHRLTTTKTCLNRHMYYNTAYTAYTAYTAINCCSVCLVMSRSLPNEYVRALPALQLIIAAREKSICWLNEYVYHGMRQCSSFARLAAGHQKMSLACEHELVASPGPPALGGDQKPDRHHYWCVEQPRGHTPTASRRSSRVGGVLGIDSTGALCIIVLSRRQTCRPRDAMADAMSRKETSCKLVVSRSYCKSDSCLEVQ